MVERWRFNQQEREELRRRLGQILLGPSFDEKRSIIEQAREAWGGPILVGQRLQALGFLAGSNPAPEKAKEEPEWAKMPEDYAGGLEEWQKLPESEKRAIYEALKQNRKIYVAKTLEEGKRAMLDSDILMGHKLKNMLKQF